MNGPIIVGGFGRSGTTWLSDIISKSLGGMILFEPFHPLVCRHARQVIYSSDARHKTHILQTWREVTDQECRNRWLLRNHLRSPIETVPQTYIDAIWQQSPILGYKTIRTNHLSAVAYDILDSVGLIYIIRHPLAVLASIINRPRFWEEFGWSWHYDQFLRTLRDSQTPDVKRWEQEIPTLNTQNQKIIFMWTISQEISLREVRKVEGYIVRYEDVYLYPFAETQKILAYLGHSNRTLHPSYLFEPSLTTLRTFHNSATGFLEDDQRFPRVFWESTIPQEEQSALWQLIRRMQPQSPEVLGYLERADTN